MLYITTKNESKICLFTKTHLNPETASKAHHGALSGSRWNGAPNTKGRSRHLARRKPQRSSGPIPSSAVVGMEARSQSDIPNLQKLLTRNKLPQTPGDYKQVIVAEMGWVW